MTNSFSSDIDYANVTLMERIPTKKVLQSNNFETHRWDRIDLETTEFSYMEVEGIIPDSHFQLSLKTIPSNIKWLVVRGVIVVFPHGGFPSHFKTIQLKDCTVHFDSYGGAKGGCPYYEQIPNDPGLEEFSMEGCSLIESNKLVFPPTLIRLELTKDNTFDGFPQGIANCNLVSYLGIPETSSTWTRGLYWYQDLMRRKESENTFNKCIMALSECLIQQLYYKNILRISASGEPHGVVPCKSRTHEQLSDDLEDVVNQSKIFLDEHSPPQKIIDVIEIMDGGTTSLKTLVVGLRLDEIDFILLYQKRKTDHLFNLTGKGNFVC